MRRNQPRAAGAVRAPDGIDRPSRPDGPTDGPLRRATKGLLRRWALVSSAAPHISGGWALGAPDAPGAGA